MPFKMNDRNQLVWVMKDGINPDCRFIPVFIGQAPGKSKTVCSCGFKIRGDNHTKGPHHNRVSLKK